MFDLTVLPSVGRYIEGLLSLSPQDLIDIEKKMIDREHYVLKTKGFLNYEFQKRGSEWYQVTANIGINNEGQSTIVHYLRAVSELVIQDNLLGRRPR